MNDPVFVSIPVEMIAGLCVLAGVITVLQVGCTAVSAFQAMILTLGVEKLKLPNPGDKK